MKFIPNLRVEKKSTLLAKKAISHRIFYLGIDYFSLLYYFISEKASETINYNKKHFGESF